MNENLGVKEISGEQAAMVERIYSEWDRAWSNDDLEAMLALYTPGEPIGSASAGNIQWGLSGAR